MNISCMTGSRHSPDNGLGVARALYSSTFPSPTPTTTPRTARSEDGRKHALQTLRSSSTSRSMASFPDYVAKFRSKMVEIRSSFRKNARMGLYNDYWIPPDLQPSSSSTPTVPFSGPDLLCGNGEGAGRGPHPAAHGAGSDELAAGDVGAWDQRGGDKQKLKELDLHGNKRPTSRNSTNRKIPSFDKVSSEREELRPIGNSLPPAKQSPLRSNGVKNNLLRADQFISSRSNGTTGREDDLVAMGTLWSPSQLQTRGSCTTISSSKSTSAPNSGSYTVYGTLPARRPINLSTTSTSTRQLLHHTTAPSTQITPNMGNGIRKEVEPKYGDPLSGAPPSFQSRLMELAALEAETARWERTKKVKKKPKADRDS